MNKTATEIQMEMREETRKALLEHLQKDENVIGNEVSIWLTHPTAGRLGVVTCKVTDWRPMWAPIKD